MLRTLMKKVENMQKQMGSVSLEMKTLRKNQRKILEIKISIIEREKKWHT